LSRLVRGKEVDRSNHFAEGRRKQKEDFKRPKRGASQLRAGEKRKMAKVPLWKRRGGGAVPKEWETQDSKGQNGREVDEKT